MASDSRRTGMASVRLSRLERNATEQSVVSLDAIHTQLALSPAVIGALKAREAAHLTCTLLSDDLLSLKSSLSKLEDDNVVATDVVKARKRDSLRNEVASLEQALQAAESEYNEIKKRLDCGKHLKQSMNNGIKKHNEDRRCDKFGIGFKVRLIIKGE